MTGSSPEPPFIVRPQSAHTVWPPAFFAALLLAGRGLSLRGSGIGKESNLKKTLDSRNFRGGGGHSAKALFASCL